jgi:Family of unknown function (DUF5681)
MAWKKGQSGNPGGGPGRPKDKPFNDLLRLILAENDKKTKLRKLRVIADKLVNAAMAGEAWAIKEVIDRVDGKPTQAIDATIDDERDVRDLSDAELKRIIEDRLARIDQLLGASEDTACRPPGKVN